MSQFAFLQREWAAVFEAASKAEAAVHADPRAACFYARRALELAVGWAYKHDAGLRLPYQDNLSALIHDPSFKQAAGEAVFGKALTANQLEFVNLIVDHLTEHGVVEPARLYESPFTDLTPRGPEGLFEANEMDELMRTLQAVRATATAA
jgi:type I site-specific restriction endonuclease